DPHPHRPDRARTIRQPAERHCEGAGQRRHRSRTRLRPTPTGHHHRRSTRPAAPRNHLGTRRDRQATCLGTAPDRPRKNRMHLCPRSAVGSNINGQPPSITVIPCCRPYSVAAGETLPLPADRCIHTCLIPSSAHSRIVASAVSGLVPITTASTPPGIDVRLG